jgi:pilus assembly protein CpaE
MRSLVLSHSQLDPPCMRARDLLRLLLGDEQVSVASFDKADRACLLSQAELIVVLLSPYPEQGLEFLERLRGEVSGKVIAVGPATDVQFVLRALQGGAVHYVNEQEMGVDLEKAVDLLTEKPETPVHRGRLIAVLGACGGSGTSTVAVNLAAVLAQAHKECVLIDLNPGRGDLAALLNVRPQYSLADVCRNEARFDRAMFEKIVVRHPLGIRLLSAPPQLSDARSLNAQGVAQALGLARKHFAHIVVDMEDCIHEEQVLTLKQATGILLVCQLNFTSLRNARKILDHLARLDLNRQRVRMVVNQHGLPNELPVDEAENALDERITLFIPADTRTMFAANNTGVPAAIKDPATKVAQSFMQVARVDFEKQPGFSGFFGRLKAV